MNHHHKTSHMRFGFDLPMDMNPNHRNSDYWVARRTAAMQIILAHPEMEAIWDSEIVPMIAPVMVHALLAEKIVSGEITLDANIEAHTSAVYGQAGEELGTHWIISGGEGLDLSEGSTPTWWNSITEEPF
jgi:hypothetical protein